MPTFYIDGDTLENATSVYTDAALTTLASDGFYSVDGIAREQSSGKLLPVQQCPSCSSVYSVNDCSNATTYYINNDNTYKVGEVIRYTVNGQGATVRCGTITGFSNVAATATRFGGGSYDCNDPIYCP